eukprot:gene32306-36470_t
MKTVRALVLSQYGGPAAIGISSIAPPVAGAGQVLVRVHAAGVNGLDWKVRDGILRDVFPLQLPAVLGIELAGVVEAVGAGVTRLRQGDRVMGAPGVLGAYAELVAPDARFDELRRSGGAAFNACSTASDAMAWQRAYERMIHQMLRDGVDVLTIANAPMPSELRESDYVVGAQLSGGWVDQQALHIARKVQSLLEADADDSLLCLLQMLADDSLGYSATHALLCGVICSLTAHKLGLDARQRRTLLDAALTMNIGMARDQDSLARQSPPPSDWQRKLIH